MSFPPSKVLSPLSNGPSRQAAEKLRQGPGRAGRGRARGTLGAAAWLVALLLLPAALRAGDRWAPGADAGPVNQLVLSGNACGPAALLSSIRCGNPQWQALARRLPGSSDRSNLLYIVRAHGLKPSSSLPGRPRWTRDGINGADLHSIAAELAAIGSLPKPATDELFRDPGESPARLLQRAHGRLRDSLAKGLPPILSLRRHVARDGKWPALRNHFVTVVRVPEKLDPRAASFTFTYLDPWGGTRREGTLRLPAAPILAADGAASPCLEALVPEANIGRDLVRRSERSTVVPALVIGRW